MLKIKENEFLRTLATLSNLTLEFKDEKLLPGTAYLGGMPIDIKIIEDSLILNSVGEFSGDMEQLSKSSNRGKGNFKRLLPSIISTLLCSSMGLRIYLVPLSPVWERDYNLRQASRPLKGIPIWYLDLSVSSRSKNISLS